MVIKYESGVVNTDNSYELVVIYFTAGETLPTNFAKGSLAINPTNKNVKMFDGTNWVTWKEGEE